MKILVTGASGQLGKSIRDASYNSDLEFVFADVVADEGVAVLDVTDETAVNAFISENGFDAIVNCAAYTDVDKAESDQEKAYRLNEHAPGVLAKAAADAGSLLIHISTDYVFDGGACVPYKEEMETCPVNVYGATKLAGENAVAASGCRYLIIRTSWLYSNYGRNFFNTIVDKTAFLSEMKVVVDQVGTPTYAPDLAQAIFHVIDRWDGGQSGVYNYSGSGVCSWYDFAVAIKEAVGHICHIVPCLSSDFPTKARRPHYSVLDKSRIMKDFHLDIPHWTESLKMCVMDYESQR